MVATAHLPFSQLLEYLALTLLGAKLNIVLGLILYSRASGTYHKHLSVRDFSFFFLHFNNCNHNKNTIHSLNLDLTIHNGVWEISEMKKHHISTPYKNVYKLIYTIHPQELNQSYNALTLETDKILKKNEYMV